MSRSFNVSFEIWNEIFSHIPRKNVSSILLTCRMFYIIGIRILSREVRWTRQDIFNQWEKSMNRFSQKSILPRQVKIGSTATSPLDVSIILPVLRGFVNLRILEIQHTIFPLHEIPQLLSSLPALRSLCLRYITRPQKMLVLGKFEVPKRTTLRTVTLDHVCATSINHDIGFNRLVSMVCAEGIKELHLTGDTIVDILDLHLVKGMHFPSTLKVLDIRPAEKTPQQFAGDLSCGMYGTTFASLITRCAPTLQQLTISTGDTLSCSNSPLHLPALERYIGPHDFLCGLQFGNSITHIWVPTPFLKCDVLWKHPFSVSADANVNLTHLSVLLWDISSMSIEELLQFCPNLIELLLEPKPHIDNTQLLSLFSAKHMNQLVCVAIFNQESKNLDRGNADRDQFILSKWKMNCPQLQFASFRHNNRFVWVEDTAEWSLVSNEREMVFPLDK